MTHDICKYSHDWALLSNNSFILYNNNQEKILKTKLCYEIHFSVDLALKSQGMDFLWTVLIYNLYLSKD